MPFGSAKVKIIRARVYGGKCSLCHEPIEQGQAYCFTSGTNTSNQAKVHYNCYKLEGAPAVPDKDYFQK